MLKKTWRNKMRVGSNFVDLIIVLLSISGYKGQEYKITKREVMPDGEISPLGFAHLKDMVPGKLTRIVGGDVTRPNEYPYQVALLLKKPDNRESLCGGTILSTQWILTAAHCLVNGVSVYVYLGAHDIDIHTNTSIQTIINVKRQDWIMHEKYVKDNMFEYDIALIRLPNQVTLDRYKNRIEIDQEKETHSGKWGKCLGWGRTVLGNASSLLRCVDLQIISNDECRKYGKLESALGDHHICTSGHGFVGHCSGDSGGPLVVSGIQVGIVSFGATDCNIGFVSVYTRVSKFSDWILNKTGLPKKRKRSASRVLSPLKALYIGIMLYVVTLNYRL